QTPTLRIPHTSGIPRRSPTVSPYDKPTSRSVEARSLQLAAGRRVSLNSFLRRREVVSSEFDSGMVVLRQS
ncbi:hypothetical protein, partial [Streptomyces subrutilus]|uniref:hypothetical protein n=1 Tax=Streptomyces subrutilus TaxID=36818 RepID=UPI0033CD681C